MVNFGKKKIYIISSIVIVLILAIFLYFAFIAKDNKTDDSTELKENNSSETVITVEKLLNTDEYITAEMPNNGTRYIKTVNGIRTNDWVDIYSGNGIYFSPNRMDRKACLEFMKNEVKNNVKQNWELTDVTEGKKIKDSYEAYYSVKGEIIHIVLINFNSGYRYFDYETGKEIPVEVIYG